MRFTRNGRSRAITAACPAAALLTEKPTPSGRTCTSKRSFETSIPTNTSCDAIILSPSCDCGREPRQLFGRAMRGSAGALLETGKTPRLLTVAAPPQPGPWPRPALRRALWTMPHRQDCFVTTLLSMTDLLLSLRSKRNNPDRVLTLFALRRSFLSAPGGRERLGQCDRQ